MRFNLCHQWSRWMSDLLLLLWMTSSAWSNWCSNRWCSSSLCISSSLLTKLSYEMTSSCFERRNKTFQIHVLFFILIFFHVKFHSCICSTCGIWQFLAWIDEVIPSNSDSFSIFWCRRKNCKLSLSMREDGRVSLDLKCEEMIIAWLTRVNDN